MHGIISTSSFIAKTIASSKAVVQKGTSKVQLSALKTGLSVLESGPNQAHFLSSNVWGTLISSCASFCGVMQKGVTSGLSLLILMCGSVFFTTGCDFPGNKTNSSSHQARTNSSVTNLRSIGEDDAEKDSIDSSRQFHGFKYEPKNRCELEHLLANNNVRLDEINTKHIKDFSLLFASPEAVGQFMMSKAQGKAIGMSPELTLALDSFQRCAGYDRRGDYAGLEFWDTSSAENMLGMFWGAENFNHPISGWNTSKVTTMERMFYGALDFNQELDKWNTGSVISMKEMFAGARHFNRPLSSWNTQNVTDMEGMFRGARDFNQQIDSWNTSKVTTMESMFKQAANFNQDLDHWCTSEVTSMKAMFLMAVAFNGKVGAWDTSKVTTMASLFEKAVSFNQPLTSWNTGSVTSMEAMFKDAQSFNQDLGRFDTGKVADMNEIFWNARSFNQDINSWHTVNVISVEGAFSDTTSLKELPKWYQEYAKKH